jgi:hypothetical protein
MTFEINTTKLKKSEDHLAKIPGVGKAVIEDFHCIGIYSINDLVDKDPEVLYKLSNKYAGMVQDRCLLYVFRTAVYYAKGGRDTEKLKWWNWKDKK